MFDFIFDLGVLLDDGEVRKKLDLVSSKNLMVDFLIGMLVLCLV